MRAVGYQNPLPIEDPAALVDIDVPKPEPAGRDLLVAVKAISVNPVDTKVRKSVKPAEGAWKILGWDAAGTVTAVGPQATLFKSGDAVFYAGAQERPGTNAEFHLVDERIVGLKPQSLGWSEAAALPLTAITAWEALFDRLQVGRSVPGAANAILIVGGVGGVGSIAVQLARTLTDLTVIATASRPETQRWVKELGAHHVIDHRKPLAQEVAALGLGAPGFVFSTTNTESASGGNRGADRAARPLCAHRQSRSARHQSVQAQKRLDALGVHVHALDVRDRRHGRAGRALERDRPPDRRRQAQDNARRALRPDQRCVSPACACPDRERPGNGKDRA